MTDDMAQETQEVTMRAEVDLRDGTVISHGGPAWMHTIVANAMSEALRLPAEQLRYRCTALGTTREQHVAAVGPMAAAVRRYLGK